MKSKINNPSSFINFLKKKKVGIFIIAKLGSKRLKNKISADVNKITLIEILIKRLIKEIGYHNLIICSSGRDSKSFLQPLKKKYRIKLFFGKNKNVLSRIINCMNRHQYKHFVRVTGDNPFTDCGAIKKMVKSHIKKKNDFTYTRSLPMGMQPEVFSYEALNKFKRQICNQNSTEYLTYFFLRDDLYKIENFRIKKVFAQQNKLSITVDYAKDLKLLKKLLKSNNGNIYLNSNKIINFLKKNTKQINIPKKVPIYCDSYDARYFFDNKKKFVFLD